MSASLPDGLVRKGGTPEFTEDTVPKALLRDHALAAGRWGLLHVLDGGVWFVDQGDGTEQRLDAPTVHPIFPENRHHLRLDGPMRCRIDFYRHADEA